MEGHASAKGVFMDVKKTGGTIERGKVVSVDGILHRVASLDRDGVELPAIKDINGNVYAEGTFVHFVSFSDGTGWIICGADATEGRAQKIFYQDTAPTEGMVPGDVWFDTDSGNVMYEYTSDFRWILRQFGMDSLTEEVSGKIDDAVDTASAAKEAADAAIVESHREYTMTDSTDPPGSSAEWSTDTPEWEEGKYIWERVVNTYGSGSTVTESPVLLTGNAGAAGEDAVLLRIDSSRGWMFKNNTVNTVLSITLYKGSKIITDAATMRHEFGAGAYLQWSWQRLNDDRYGIISSDDPHISDGGFKFTLTPDDVDTKVTFQCSLNI